MPNFRGATILYNLIIVKLFSKYERQIDDVADKLKKGIDNVVNTGNEAINKTKEFKDVLCKVPTNLFSKEKKYIAGFKKAILMVAGGAVQKLMQQLGKEQEVLMNLADMLIELYVSESTQLRVEKLVNLRGEDACKEQLDIMRVYINDAAEHIAKSGKEAINAFADGDERRMMLMGLKRFTKTEDFNTTQARRNIAAKLIEENKYCF